MTDKLNEDLPQKGKGDTAHLVAKTVISAVPYFGGPAAEIFHHLIASPIEQRRDEWLKSIYDDLQKLEEKYESFETEVAFKHDVFVSTFLQASRHAVANHNEENRRDLLDAVLNSAVARNPDEIQQKIFVEWAGELTAWHIQILRLFETEQQRIPYLHLDSDKWQLNIATSKLANVIEEIHPEMRGNFHLYMQIVRELHSMGLITNSSPEKDMVAQIHHQPVLSSVGKEFLEFITSPLNTEI